MIKFVVAILAVISVVLAEVSINSIFFILNLYLNL